MKVYLIVLILVSSLYSKKVSLTATILYINDTNQIVKDVYLRVHIPSETFYQELIQINVIGNENYIIKNHKNSSEKYIELHFNLLPNLVEKKEIRYILNINPKKIDIKKYLFKNNLEKESKYLKSSENIELESNQIREIAYDIVKNGESLYDHLKLAYEFPSKYLTFVPSGKKNSVLTALTTKEGDCTEFSYLFVALSRSLGIPARETSVFSFKKNSDFLMPNHNSSEIFIDKYGWIPIDSNLSYGNYENEYSLGNISDNIIVFSQEKNWTWSSYISKTNKIDLSKIKVSIKWDIKILGD